MTPPSPRPAKRPRRGLLAGAPVTQVIVITTVACWLVDLIPGVELGMLLGFSPLLAATEPWRALTVMVVHADVLHLLFNMVGVLLFGTFVERALGPLRYLAVYLLSGLGGSAAVLLLAAPYGPGWFSIHVGASGALFGLLGVVLTPTRSLDRNWSGAVVFLVINVVYSAVSPGISWQSHVGGLVIGFALGCAALLPRARTRRGQRDQAHQDRQSHQDRQDRQSHPAHQDRPVHPGVVRTSTVSPWFWVAASILVVTMVVAVLPALQASALMVG